MARIAVVTPVIRPGGGPAGYTFNLEAGLARVTTNNVFTFLGARTATRTSLLHKSTHTPLQFRVLNELERVFRGELRRFRAKAVSHFSEAAKAGRSLIDKSDIVVFQGMQSPGQAAYAKSARKTVVYMPHSPTPAAHERTRVMREMGLRLAPSVHNALLREEQQLFALADRIVFPSQNASLTYRQAFDIESARVRYLPSGVEDPGLEHPPIDNVRESVKFAFAGRYVEHKGFDLFCDAAALVEAECPGRAAFISLGTGPIPSRSPVIDMGWQSNPHVTLNDVDVVVSANRVAYFDLMPLETAALGKAVILTPVGGSLDQGRMLPASVVAASPTPRDIAEAMKVAIQMFSKDPSWGKQNRMAYLKHFTAEAMVRSWDLMLTALVDETPTTG